MTVFSGHGHDPRIAIGASIHPSVGLKRHATAAKASPSPRLDWWYTAPALRLVDSGRASPESTRRLKCPADVRDLSEGTFRRSLIDTRPEDRQRERLSARDDAVEVEIFQRRMGIAA